MFILYTDGHVRQTIRTPRLSLGPHRHVDADNAPYKMPIDPLSRSIFADRISVQAHPYCIHFSENETGNIEILTTERQMWLLLQSASCRIIKTDVSPLVVRYTNDTFLFPNKISVCLGKVSVIKTAVHARSLVRFTSPVIRLCNTLRLIT